MPDSYESAEQHAADSRFFYTQNGLFAQVRTTAATIVEVYRLSMPNRPLTLSQCRFTNEELFEATKKDEGIVLTTALNHKGLQDTSQVLWKLTVAHGVLREEYHLRLGNGLAVEKRQFNNQGRLRGVSLEPNVKLVWGTIESCLDTADIQKMTQKFRKVKKGIEAFVHYSSDDYVLGAQSIHIPEVKCTTLSKLESYQAQDELQSIFSNANTAQAEKLYNQGRYEIVYRIATKTSCEERHNALTKIAHELSTKYWDIAFTHQLKKPPAALFYIYVETLTEIANRAYDRSS